MLQGRFENREYLTSYKGRYEKTGSRDCFYKEF